MRKLRIPIIDIVRPLSLAAVAVALLAGLMIYHLGSIHPGISQNEVPVVQAVQSNSLSGRQILQENSLYLPHKLGTYAIEKAGFTSISSIRAVGAVFGIMGVIAFYIIVRKWHTRRIAIMTTVLLATSSWFLHSSRLASPEVSYLLVPWLIYFGIRLQENNLRLVGLGTIFLLVTLMLYIPGMVLFIVPVAIWQRERLLKEVRQTGRLQTGVLGLGVLLGLVPLVLTFVHDSSLVLDWLGMTSSNLSIIEFLKNLLGIPLQIFARSDYDPATHVGRLPYLDIATTTFIALGFYRYFFQRKLDRTKLLVAGLAGGAILGALNLQAVSVLLPFLYLLAAAGITLLLQQWFTIFPRNPLARNTGVMILVGVLAMTSFYHLQRYFVAWPNTPETRQAYSIPPKTQ